ncbi:MAG: sugar ABC transporter substrate-binding protein [Candidatus Hydrogenedentota bacterium]
MRKIFISLVILSSLIYFSCGKKTKEEPTQPQTGAKVTIEFMMWGAPDELETVKGYIEQFKTENSDIDVKIIHKNDYQQALKTMFAGRTPPDVMYMSLENFPDYASRDQLLDLTPYIEKDQFSLDDFYSQLLPHFKWNDKYYGIPKDFTTLVLYYNKDLFNASKVDYPTDKWTWDDFLNACKALTKDFEGDGTIDQYGFVVETWLGEYMPWIYQNGGKIISEDNKKWLLGDPEYIDKNAEAIQFLADLIYKHKVAPATQVTRDKSPSAIFMTGKAAMCTYGRWMCMQFKDIKDFDWDVAVLPSKNKRFATLFTVAYSIAKTSKHPDEAWRLVKYLTGPVGQKATARSGHAIPSIKSIASSDDFINAPALPQKINARVFLDSIEYSAPTPTNVKWTRIDEKLGKQLQYVWENKKGAKEAIIALQKEAQAILDETE